MSFHSIHMAVGLFTTRIQQYLYKLQLTAHFSPAPSPYWRWLLLRHGNSFQLPCYVSLILAVLCFSNNSVVFQAAAIRPPFDLTCVTKSRTRAACKTIPQHSQIHTHTLPEAIRRKVVPGGCRIMAWRLWLYDNALIWICYVIAARIRPRRDDSAQIRDQRRNNRS